MNGDIQYGRKFQRPQENPLMMEAQNKLDSGVKDLMNTKKKTKDISMSGDFIFKDVQFFKIEIIIVLVTVAATVVAVVIGAFLQITSIDGLKQYMSSQAFDKVTEFSTQNLIFGFIGAAIPLLIFVFLFAFKYMMFYPTGHKKFVIRSWQSGATRLSIDNFKSNTIKFDPSVSDADEVYVGNVRKNYDMATGKPIIHLEEGEFENTPLCRSSKSPEKLKDMNTIKSGAFALGRRVERHNLLHGGGFFSNPTNILLIIIILAIAVLGVFLFMQSGGVSGLMSSAQSLTAHPGA